LQAMESPSKACPPSLSWEMPSVYAPHATKAEALSAIALPWAPLQDPLPAWEMSSVYAPIATKAEALPAAALQWAPLQDPSPAWEMPSVYAPPATKAEALPATALPFEPLQDDQPPLSRNGWHNDAVVDQASNRGQGWPQQAWPSQNASLNSVFNIGLDQQLLQQSASNAFAAPPTVLLDAALEAPAPQRMQPAVRTLAPSAPALPLMSLIPMPQALPMGPPATLCPGALSGHSWPTQEAQTISSIAAPAAPQEQVTPQEQMTTVMIRNLPPHITQACLVKELAQCGFEGTYNFLYMPQSFNTNEKKCVKGFAFINFIQSSTADALAERWHRQHRFGMNTKQAPLNICPADIQGLEANLRKWATPRLRRIRNPNLRPFVLEEHAKLVSVPAPVESTTLAAAASALSATASASEASMVAHAVAAAALWQAQPSEHASHPASVRPGLLPQNVEDSHLLPAQQPRAERSDSTRAANKSRLHDATRRAEAFIKNAQALNPRAHKVES